MKFMYKHCINSIIFCMDRFSFTLLVFGWLNWIKPAVSKVLNARGILEFIITGEYYRNISPAAHPHACIPFNALISKTTTLLQQRYLPTLLLHFKNYWTVSQIANIKTAYHCFAPQFWNLAHPTIFRHLMDMIHSPLAAPLVNKSRIPPLPKNRPY